MCLIGVKTHLGDTQMKEITYTTQELLDLGFSRNRIWKLKEEGALELIERGVYKKKKEFFQKSKGKKVPSLTSMWRKLCFDKYGMIFDTDLEKQASRVNKLFGNVSEDKKEAILKWLLFEADVQHPIQLSIVTHKTLHRYHLATQKSEPTLIEKILPKEKTETEKMDVIDIESELQSHHFTTDQFDRYVFGEMPEKELRQIMIKAGIIKE